MVASALLVTFDGVDAPNDLGFLFSLDVGAMLSHRLLRECSLLLSADLLLPFTRPSFDVVVARGVMIRLDCARDGHHVSCEVEQRFELSAGASGARLFAPTSLGFSDLELTVNGEASRGDVRLAAGERASFEVRYVVETPRGSTLLVPAVDLRHVVLGEGERFYRRVELSVPVLAGEEIEVEGGVAIEASASGLSVYVGAARVDEWPHRTPSLPALAVRHHHEARAFANGGPAVAIGGRIDLGAPGGRFWLAVGYEVGLFEHLIASLWLETDLESISEALLIEAALPGLFILPSLSGGVGLVLTQLGPRNADAALRIRLALSSYALGVIADFDYFPSTGTWTAGVAARLGL